MMGASALGTFVILIMLFVGLAKVLTHIEWMEEMKKHGWPILPCLLPVAFHEMVRMGTGLHMEPDLEDMDVSAFFYSAQAHHWGDLFKFAINSTIQSQFPPSSICLSHDHDEEMIMITCE